MIRLQRMDGKTIVINAEQIQSVENVPDTIITLTNGTRLMVRNTIEEVERLFVEYKRNLSSEKFEGKS